MPFSQAADCLVPFESPLLYMLPAEAVRLLLPLLLFCHNS